MIPRHNPACRCLQQRRGRAKTVEVTARRRRTDGLLQYHRQPCRRVLQVARSRPVIGHTGARIRAVIAEAGAIAALRPAGHSVTRIVTIGRCRTTTRAAGRLAGHIAVGIVAVRRRTARCTRARRAFALELVARIVPVAGRGRAADHLRVITSFPITFISNELSFTLSSTIGLSTPPYICEHTIPDISHSNTK